MSCVMMVVVVTVSVWAGPHRQEDSMNAEMNTLKLEQRSSLDAVHAKEREMQKIQASGRARGARVHLCLCVHVYAYLEGLLIH